MKTNLKFCSTWYAFALTLFGISFHTFNIIVWQLWLLGIEFIVPISRLKKIEFSILKNPNWHISQKKDKKNPIKAPVYYIYISIYLSHNCNFLPILWTKRCLCLHQYPPIIYTALHNICNNRSGQHFLHIREHYS